MQGKNRIAVGGTLGSNDSSVKEGRPEYIWGWGGANNREKFENDVQK